MLSLPTMRIGLFSSYLVRGAGRLTGGGGREGKVEMEKKEKKGII
jgi:hypothetical protein